MTPRKRSRDGLVYSTGRSHLARCKECGRDPCRCEPAATASPTAQAPRVRREIKGRGGKAVTVVYDLKLTVAELKDLARQLRQVCASGGTVKEGRIEIQGDHRDAVVNVLQGQGYRAKAAGG